MIRTHPVFTDKWTVTVDRHTFTGSLFECIAWIARWN